MKKFGTIHRKAFVFKIYRIWFQDSGISGNFAKYFRIAFVKKRLLTGIIELVTVSYGIYFMPLVHLALYIYMLEEQEPL